MLQERDRVIGVTLVEGYLFHTRILLQMCNCNQFETSYRPAAKQLQYIPGASNFDNIELIFMYKATYVRVHRLKGQHLFKVRQASEKSEIRRQCTKLEREGESKPELRRGFETKHPLYPSSW